MPLINCEQCNIPMVAARSDARFCSDACRVAFKRNQVFERDTHWREKRCPVCGTGFKSKRNDAKFCSTKCRVKKKRLNDNRKWEGNSITKQNMQRFIELVGDDRALKDMFSKLQGKYGEVCAKDYLMLIDFVSDYIKARVREDM